MKDHSVHSDRAVTPTAPKPLRVLVVEDEALVSLFLEELLSDLGHVVVGVAASATAAYAIAAQHPIDLAIVDISLQGGSDGVDLAVRLRQQYDMPSLVMSGRYESAVQQRLQQAAPLGYLQKPYTQSDVECALARAHTHLAID